MRCLVVMAVVAATMAAPAPGAASRLDFQPSPFDPEAGPWTWTGDRIVQFSAAGAEAVVMAWALDGTSQELGRISMGNDRWRPGSVVLADASVILLGNVVPYSYEDTYGWVGMESIVVLDLASSTLRLVAVPEAVAWDGATFVGAGAFVWVLRDLWSQQTVTQTLWTLDPRTGAVERKPWGLPFHVRGPGLYTGVEVILQGDGPTFLGVGVLDGAMRPFGDEEAASRSLAAALDGDQMLLLQAGHISGQPAPSVARADLDDGELHEVGTVPWATWGMQVAAVDGRFLVLGAPETCHNRAGSAWIEAGEPDFGGLLPVAKATLAARAHHPELAPRSFYVAVDTCPSLDHDGLIVRAEVVQILPTGHLVQLHIKDGVAGEWTAAGLNRYRVTVWDEDGNVDTAWFEVTVDGRAPQADFSVARAGRTIEADATGSHDQGDGQIVAYHWSWGDGSYDNDPGAARPVREHAYDQPGTYQVALTVVDNEGQRATTNRTVEVGTWTDAADEQRAPVAWPGAALAVFALAWTRRGR